MSSIRIAHISDLHASPENDAAQRVVEAAIRDLEQAHDEKGIDLVAFSGDLAGTGKAVDYELAHDWLIEPLRASLGLDMSRFVLVPGNHDVDRSTIDKYQEGGLRNALVDQAAVSALMSDAEALSHASGRLSAWADYYSLVTDGVAEEEATPLARTRTLSIDSLEVGVASLNTAWRSAGDDDRGYLVLGSDQVDAALANVADCDLRVVLMHHPYSWLARFDADSTRDAIETSRTLVLSGHDHIPDPTAEFSLRGGAIYSRAGCLFESPKRLNGFTLIDLDLARNRANFLLRSWYPAPRNAFDQATHLAEDGRLELTWIEKDLAPVSADYSTVLESLGQLASDLSVVGALQQGLEPRVPKDILVEPRLWPAPYREIAAARDLDDSVDPESSDPLSALDSCRVLLVTGEPESGVSGALLWILSSHFEQRGTHTPFSTRYDKRFKSNTFEKRVRRNAMAAGQRTDDKLDPPPSIIGLDDMHLGGHSAAFVKYVKEHERHIFVLGCHEENQDDIADALTAGNVDFKQLHLGPLGRAQVRNLIEKLGGISQEEVDRIFNLIVSQHLPRTPLLIAALIVAIQQNQDPESFNESALLDACVRVLLTVDDGIDDSQLRLDPRHREHLLAWFAGQMTRNQTKRFSPLKAEEEFAAYFRDRGWGAQTAPSDIISSLINRRVLVRDHDGVGFRHDALRELFAGKRLNDDRDFAKQILSMPFAHEKAVRHAAGLRRDDRQLLATIHDKARDLLNRVGEELPIELFDRIKDEKGWSDKDPDIEYLRALLAQQPEEPDQEERDQELDRLYDNIEYDDESSPEPPESLADLDPATGLLSGVLKHSELVPDVALKAEALKDAIHGWSLIAIVMAVKEDQTSEVHDRVESEDVAEVIDAGDESAARVAELMITMIISILIAGSLGSSKLEEVAEKVLDDEEFMKPTAHALFATVFYVLLRFKNWDKRLTALHESHNSHPIVRHLAFSLATSIYKSPLPKEAETGHLEDFLVEQVSPDTGRKGGVVDSRVKDNTRKELRAGRQKALLARKLKGGQDDVATLEEGGN